MGEYKRVDKNDELNCLEKYLRNSFGECNDEM